MKNQNTIKSILLKTGLVFVSLMYVVSPIHDELYGFFHNISHQLESKTNTIASHHQHTQKTSSHHHDHDISSHLVEENNDHHQNEKIEQDHSHELLSFLGSLFTANEFKSNSDKQIVETKLDKHTIPLRFLNQKTIITNYTSKTWFYYLKLDHLGLDVTTPPPKFHFI